RSSRQATRLLCCASPRLSSLLSSTAASATCSQPLLAICRDKYLPDEMANHQRLMVATQQRLAPTKECRRRPRRPALSQLVSAFVTSDTESARRAEKISA